MEQFIPDARQEEVIRFNGGRALVLAPPGCGKTAILSRRVVDAHKRYGTTYAQMLCLTFSNRTSRAVRDRVCAEMGVTPTGLFVGNLHRFCIRFLSENRIIPSDTGILDDTDRAEAIAEILTPNDTPQSMIKSYTLREVINTTLAIFEREHFPRLLHIHPLEPQHELAARQYIEFKKENRLIDFDDILMLTYKALLKSDYRGYKMSSYKWIQVDEVQDLNPLQLAIIERLKADDYESLLYIGDSRQAIYSFLGAKEESLRTLQDLCSSNIFTLADNYRMPSYLLDMLNDYARDILRLDNHLPPQSVDTRHDADALLLARCRDANEQYNVLSSLVRRIYNSRAKEMIAVLVRTNEQADIISSILESHRIPHLKLTKKDMFKEVSFKTLYSHFAVVANETSYSDWVRVLYGTHVVATLALARRCVKRMRDIGMTPADMITYPGSSYLIEACKAFERRELVVFNTMTTDLGIFNEDIIRIDAVKVRNGEVVPDSRFDIIITTDKEIPPTLGHGESNPMADEYAAREHYSPQQAFEMFLDYVGDDELVGHGIDFHILENNIRRRTVGIAFSSPTFWDTLKMTRRLERANTRDDVDGVMATVSLLKCCYRQMKIMVTEQVQFLAHSAIRDIQANILTNYAPVYRHTAALLYSPVADSEHSFDSELQHVYDFMTERRYVEPIERFHYMRALFNDVVTDSEKDRVFFYQLIGHLHEIRIFNEADLYQNDIVKERVHIMTIHKAKGLEFDNVLIYNVTEGVIPYCRSENPDEEARVLYVAMSRAKKRLFITYEGQISPFIENHPNVKEHFREMTEREKRELLEDEQTYINPRFRL